MSDETVVFGDIATNTVKVTNMVEAPTTHVREMFFEIKIAIECNEITSSVQWLDAMIKDG